MVLSRKYRFCMFKIQWVRVSTCVRERECAHVWEIKMERDGGKIWG